jgi:hypothetical protein
MDYIVLASLHLAAARMHRDAFPGDTHASDNVDMREELLDNAIGAYQAERDRDRQIN